MTTNNPLFKQTLDVILAARQPLFIAHQKPDGDTLGAVCSFINYAREANFPYLAFCLDTPPKQFNFLPGIEHLIHNEEEVLRQPIDVAVVLDSGDLNYAGVAALIARLKALRPVTVINIDHHHTNERFGDVNLVVVDAASTTEIIANMFHGGGVKLTKDIATCLLTGVLTDTGGFSNPATTFTAIAEAAYLLTHGARFKQITDRLTKNKTVTTLKLWGRVLARLKTNQRLGIASTVITLEDLVESEVDEEAMEGLANFLNSLTNVKASLMLKEMPDQKIKGSFRTTNAVVDVSSLAKVCGGGGHKKAAGFTINGRLIKQPDGAWRIV